MTTDATTIQASEVSRMGATVAPGSTGFHPQRGPSQKLRATKVADVARVLGCSEASAHKKLYGPHAVNLEAAAILEVLIRRGETQDAAAFEAPISAAMMGESIPKWQDAIYLHNQSDAVEDCGQAEWIRTSCDENLDAYIKKLAGDIHHAEVLLASLIRERDTRRAAK